MTSTIRTTLALVLTSALLGGCAGSRGPAPSPPTATSETTREAGKVTRTETVRVQAKVVAINQRTRVVTLRDAQGGDHTFRAGEAVTNLPQVRRGDMVTAEYTRALALRLRKPGETIPPPQAGGGMAKAWPGEKPGLKGVDAVQDTATITKIDRATNQVTLRIRKEEPVVLTAEDPTILDKVKVGDKVEVTYTEAMAITVEKPKR